MNTVLLNTVHLNHASLNGVGERLRASAGGGGGEVIPPDVPVTYTLNASASNGVVSASVNGNAVTLPYTANEGDVVVVEVTANDGYEFEGWSDGSTDNPRSITMTADVTLSATCVEQVVESKYIQFADPAVEAVLMSKGVSSDGIGITMEDAAKVTSIGTWFKGNTVIVSFEELKYFINVTELTGSAFEGCTNLVNINLTNIVKLNGSVFKNTSSLGEVNAPKLTTTSGDSQFSASGVTSAYLPMLPTITNYMFHNCTNLKAVDASSATAINYRAFLGCTSLASIVAPKVKTIGGSALQSCSSLAGDYEFTELTTFSGDANFRSTGLSKFKALKVTSLPAYVFHSCPNLKVVEVQAVTTIGGNAMAVCPLLTSFVCRATTPPSLSSTSAIPNTCTIYVPDASVEAYKTATNWNSYADRIRPLSEIEGSPYIQFEDAEVERVLMANGVSSDGIGITMADAQAVTRIGTWFTSNTTIRSFQELEFFTSVKEVGYRSFEGCTALEKIDLRKLLSIGAQAFMNCAKLAQDIELPLCTSFGNNAFNGCSAITKLIAPKAKSLGIGICNSCTSLTQADLSSATVIGNASFKECTNLEEVVTSDILATVGGDAFNGCAKLKGDINVENVTSLGNATFTNCSALTQDMHLKSLAGAVAGGFRGSGIRSLAFPLATSAYVYQHFMNCQNLKYVLYGNTVTSIGTVQLFDGCTSLEAIIILNTEAPTLYSAATLARPTNCPIYVPDASVELYKEANNFNGYAAYIKGISDLQTDNPTLYAEIAEYL